jgi:uncharacterized protein (DUF58 family)
MIKKHLSSLYFSNQWYGTAIVCILLFVIAFFIPWIWHIALVLTILWICLSIIDIVLLWNKKNAVSAHRLLKERWDLGNDNGVDLALQNHYAFSVKLNIIDEIPEQFQERNFTITTRLQPLTTYIQAYRLKPLSRGEYHFGRIIMLIASPLGLVLRRMATESEQVVKVYPSTQYLKQYQLLALSDNVQFSGIKKTRKLGHSLEFEQIKEYVNGDDIRTLNWKATARKGALMVNNYTDTKSQQIYCIIDKGRSMKMPFDGMSLLDYAINAALIFLNVALLKQDRAGLITLSSKVNDIIPAERNAKQLQQLNETLYKQTTSFDDTNFEALTTLVYRKISNRGFLLLFTNFETMVALERQLPYLKQLASRHLLCLVLFQNALLQDIHQQHPDTLEGIYIKTIADRFHYEKKQMVKELRRHGIIAILSTPQSLTVDVVNQYLELKAKQLV